MPLPRMTTRRWMIVVAIVGPLIGIRLREWRDDRYARQREAYFRSRMQFHREAVEAGDLFWCSFMMNSPQYKKWQREQSLTPRRRAYHVAMYQKYERAACQPWLSLEHDPPEPE
jgi:hypothetical protein